MEALRELEKVQRVLSLMSSRGLSDSGGCGPAADRFLAQFLLFLTQPLDSLSTEMKLQLISELLRKATPETLEEVRHLSSLEADQDISSGAVLQPNKKLKMHAEKLTIKAMPMVGFDAMTRANSTLEDFCRSYFMFHGLDVSNPQSIFKYLPVLSFTESYIYQLDASNESCLHLAPDDIDSSTVLERKKQSLDGVSLSQMIEPLEDLLQSQGLMTDRLRNELKSGIQYWSLETKLCQALQRHEKISIEDVMKAIHLKSFDYRVLNLLMYQLTGQQVNELHMEFLSVSEFLVEISDDLLMTSVETDVVPMTYLNVLQVRL
ncbi:hypothetical protein ACP70R_009739 [Stipagrostis hirtigluma subsp. patula]